MSTTLEQMPTLEILNQGRYLEFKEEKDRIYAFMALPTSDGFIATLQPDYRRSKRYLEVYRDFAVKYVGETSDPDILSVVEHDQDADLRGSFPSWIPRWDRGNSVETMFDLTAGKVIRRQGQMVKLSEDQAELEVTAIFIGDVEFASEVVKSSGGLREVITTWRDIRPYAKPKGHDTALAFLVALHCGKHNISRNEWAEQLKCFARSLQSDSSEPSMNTSSCSCDHQIAHATYKFLPPESRNRRLIIFNGGSFGLAPCLTKQGDLCAFVLGTRSSFILRRVAGHKYHYKLVGTLTCRANFRNRTVCQ
jgi:hypothetical protein